MASQLHFTKMHGLGNDFLVIDRFVRPQGDAVDVTPELARKICDRRTGIGADQVLIVGPARGAGADYRMDILNSDGSVAEMCGNGIRAVAMYVHARVAKPREQYAVETLAGVKTVEVREGRISVDMGVPVLGAKFTTSGEAFKFGEQRFYFFEVNMGNPHAVFFEERVDEFPLEIVGPKIERHERFPERTNVEFVEITGHSSIKVRVWERGAGLTLACGTGACASAVAAIGTGRVTSPVEVALPGGRLRISWGGPGQPVVMEGPAEEVFSGEVGV